MKLKQNHKYEIKWLDANSVPDWFAEEGIKATKTIVVESLGYYIVESGGYYCFSSFYSKNSTYAYGNVFKIPKGCIIKMKEIK